MSEQAKGPSIGTYRGHEVPEWITAGAGERLYFRRHIGNRRSVDLRDDLGADEVAVSPGLIYGPGSRAAMVKRGF